jgi:hypothetical protein
MQKLAADAVVEADTARDLLHIAADLLAEVRDFVDEGNLGRQKRVGGVFDKLRIASAGIKNRRQVEAERAINLRHDFPGAVVIGADDDPIGMLEIVDRGAFTQEFRV